MGVAAVYKIYGLLLAERLPIVPFRVKDYLMVCWDLEGSLHLRKLYYQPSALKSLKYITKASSGPRHQGSSVKAGLSLSMVQLTQPGRGSKSYIYKCVSYKTRIYIFEWE